MKPSDKEEAEWRAEFKRLGREAVRHKLHVGGFGLTRQGETAERWLWEQEVAAERRKKWIFAVIVATLSFIFIGIFVMFG